MEVYLILHSLEFSVRNSAGFRLITYCKTFHRGVTNGWLNHNKIQHCAFFNPICIDDWFCFDKHWKSHQMRILSNIVVSGIYCRLVKKYASSCDVGSKLGRLLAVTSESRWDRWTSLCGPEEWLIKRPPKCTGHCGKIVFGVWNAFSHPTSDYYFQYPSSTNVAGVRVFLLVKL